ncbi:MAG: helix-turn-helix domain-containing protein [Chitinispirillales bacterium]|jgi:cytoskeletal protein RodZ|nr:helix-turn-helix domain-containing protein [Chitinispirillales bacterium]
MAEKNSENRGSANAAPAGKDTAKDAAKNAGKDAPKEAAKDTVKEASKDTTVQEAVKEPVKEKVGEILRKERLTRRINIETIAKDLKLNVNYVKALEASDYDSLPADPYIRVYIRSLTKYLSLDAESILKEFYKERGLIADDSLQPQVSKIDVSVQQQDKNPAIIVIAALIVIFAVFAFIANQKGWISQPQETATTSVDEKADTGSSAIDHDALSKKIADSILDATIAGQRQESETPTPVTKTKSMNAGAGIGKQTPPPPTRQ